MAQQPWWKSSLAQTGSEYFIVDIHPFHVINFLPYDNSKSEIYSAFIEYLTDESGSSFADVWGTNEIWDQMKMQDIDECHLLDASVSLGIELWGDAASRRGLDNENYLCKVIDTDGLIDTPVVFRDPYYQTAAKLCVDSAGGFHIWPDSLLLTGPAGWFNSIARNIADSNRLISRISDKLHHDFFIIIAPEKEQGFFDAGIEYAPMTGIDEFNEEIQQLKDNLKDMPENLDAEELESELDALRLFVEDLRIRHEEEEWGEETHRVITQVPAEVDDDAYIPGYSTLGIGTLFNRLSSSIDSIDPAWLRDEPRTPILLGSPCEGVKWMHWRNGLVSASWTGPADFGPVEDESDSPYTGDNRHFNCLCEMDTISLAYCMLHYGAEPTSSSQGRRANILIALLDDFSDTNRAHELLERNLGPARNVLRELGIEGVESLNGDEVTRYVTTLFGLQRLDRQRLSIYFSNLMSNETDLGVIFSWLDGKLVELFLAWAEMLPMLLIDTHREFHTRFEETSEEITKAAGGRSKVNFSKPTWGDIISFVRIHHAYMSLDEDYESHLKEKMLPRSVMLASEETIEKLECITHQRNYGSHTDATLTQDVYRKVGWRKEHWDNSELVRNISEFLEELYHISDDICSQPTRMLVTGINKTTHGSFAQLYCLRNGLSTKLRLHTNSNKILLSANRVSTPIRVGQRLLVWPTTNPDLVDPVVIINR